MDILNSAWFLGMLKKSGATPAQRLLNLFDILGDWLDAPHTCEHLQAPDGNANQPRALLEYLIAQARATGVRESESLAQQLYFMANSMLQEELRSPRCAAAKHARQVAQALIQAQTVKHPFISKRSVYAMVASVFMLTAISSLLMFDTAKPLNTHIAATTPMMKPPIFLINPEAASPEQSAAMFATLEKMHKGTCQFPEALMFPDAQKGVYIENVVAG